MNDVKDAINFQEGSIAKAKAEEAQMTTLAAEISEFTISDFNSLTPGESRDLLLRYSQKLLLERITQREISGELSTTRAALTERDREIEELKGALSIQKDENLEISSQVAKLKSQIANLLGFMTKHCGVEQVLVHQRALKPLNQNS